MKIRTIALAAMPAQPLSAWSQPALTAADHARRIDALFADAPAGQPGFAATLSVDTTDAILAYVIKRANDEKAVQEAAAKGN